MKKMGITKELGRQGAEPGQPIHIKGQESTVEY